MYDISIMFIVGCVRFIVFCVGVGRVSVGVGMFVGRGCGIVGIVFGGVGIGICGFRFVVIFVVIVSLLTFISSCTTTTFYQY